jgi:hypothetical protein
MIVSDVMLRTFRDSDIINFHSPGGRSINYLLKKSVIVGRSLDQTKKRCEFPVQGLKQDDED